MPPRPGRRRPGVSADLAAIDAQTWRHPGPLRTGRPSSSRSARTDPSHPALPWITAAPNARPIRAALTEARAACPTAPRGLDLHGIVRIDARLPRHPIPPNP